MERACNTFLDPMSQKKTISREIIMLSRHFPNNSHQMLPWSSGENTSVQNNFDFKFLELLMEAGRQMVEKRQFEKIYNMTKKNFYSK